MSTTFEHYEDIRSQLETAVHAAWGETCTISFGRPKTALASLPRAIVALSGPVSREVNGHTTTNSWSFEVLGAFAIPTAEDQPFQMARIQELIDELEPEFPDDGSITIRDGFGQYGFMPRVSEFEAMEMDDADGFVSVRVVFQVETEVLI